MHEFHDHEGRPLADRVNALGVGVQSYLGLILFIDGTRDKPCSGGAVGFTAAGIRVVRICAAELKRMSQERPEYVAGALIHEMLHTLGLGENPPTSKEITRRVLDRCSIE